MRPWLPRLLTAVLAALPLLALAASGDPRAAFRRPTELALPPGVTVSEPLAQLGERLFFDPRLSGDSSTSCASCHDPARLFQDGRRFGAALGGGDLPRRTPALHDLAWGAAFFWDGRAASLESQMLGPLTSPREMNQMPAALVAKLQAVPEYRRAFARVFPDGGRIDMERIGQALAAYERTLRSGTSPFDRWAAGDEAALSAKARQGFALFTGKGHCADCHSGWRFTDDGFHDIGLPVLAELGPDRGRGAILQDGRFDFAMKTPSLRDIARRAPFMHDGRFATLKDVLRHYTFGVEARPTLSKELRPFDLDDAEADALLAFLESLSADAPPPPLRYATAQPVVPVATERVSQFDRQFKPEAVLLQLGRALRVLNDDTRPHNLLISDPRLSFNSGIQAPGEAAELLFLTAGDYDVICGIHPRMRLHVTVVAP